MHRDLKPLNVMLDENFNLKLIDFGDAKIIEQDVIEEEQGSTSELEESDLDDDEDDGFEFGNSDDEEKKDGEGL